MIKYLPPIILLLIVNSTNLKAQDIYCSEINEVLQKNNQCFPFGVASGDPSMHAIVLWTALNPYRKSASDSVLWEISLDENFGSIHQKGYEKIEAQSAYSIKVHVNNLLPGNYYYYRFTYANEMSGVGRTKTVSENPEQLKFAVASCSNLEWGYFNAYSSISKIEDLDAVIHLGDYIYEYGPGKYGNKKLTDRKHVPVHEIITLQDYRSRYAQYRLDKDLQELHRKFPFITVWDDHELANDAYEEGAQNHQANEGNWLARKEAATQAYFEWLPVPDNEQFSIRRKLSFGKLAELFMLDGRLEGRSKQVSEASDPVRFDSSRSMLGAEQRDWLINEVSASGSKWKLIGNQVIFSAYDYPSKLTAYSKSMDMWEGYPIERDFILDAWHKNNVKDIIILTGDVHASFSMDLRKNYLDPSSTIGKEWVTTSITSASLNEYIPTWKTRIVERWFTKGKLNPHLEYINFRDHGFLLVSINQQEARAEWRFEKNILRPAAKTKKVVKRNSKIGRP
jgi:alkaline phosphatase D